MCNFDLPFTGSASGFVDKIKNKIEGAGGTFNGNESNGTFSVATPIGGIEGNYSVNGQAAAINITQKPFLLSCKAIEKYVVGDTDEKGA